MSAGTSPEAKVSVTTQRSDWLAGGLCVLVGVMFAILPHLLWWRTMGGPYWVASNDEMVFYLPVASKAYYEHPFTLSDPTLRQGGTTMYPWLQLAPGVIAAKAFGLPPQAIPLLWRLWAGISIGLGLFLVLRHFTKRPWLSAALAIFLMSDTSMAFGRLVDRQFTIYWRLLNGQDDYWFSGWPYLLQQWRLITPGLSLFFLLFHVWSLARACDQPTRNRLLIAGIGLGLLFYTYFYFWTAAALALLLGLIVDLPRHKVYFHTSWIGGLIGLPSLLLDAATKSASSTDWLQRSDKFLPVSRFSELILHKGIILYLIITLAWVWFRRRDLIYLWLLAFAGLVLCNHQVITKLQLENNHWGNVLGPALSILLVLMVSHEAARSNLSRRCLQWSGVLLVCAEVWIGVQFRIWESLFSRQPIELQAAYQSYVQQRPSTQSPRLVPGSVVAGDELFANWSVVLENTRSLKGSAFVSPSVNNANWTERVALNRFLEGVGPQAFEAEQRAELARAVTGPWARDSQKRDQHLAELVAAYRAIEADPAGALRRLEVRYVALPAGQRAPACLKNGWQRVQAGPNWQIWDFSASSRDAR